MWVCSNFKLLTTSSRYDGLKVIPFSGTYVRFLIYDLLISQFKELVSAVWKLKALINLAATTGIWASSTDWRTQTRALILLRPQVSPLSLPHSLPSSTTPAGWRPSSHQLQPIPCSAGSCLCDPEGLTESGRSEVALPTATHGTSQKSAYQKPCGDPPTWPLESVGENRRHPPPVLLNNGLAQSL